MAAAGAAMVGDDHDQPLLLRVGRPRREGVEHLLDLRIFAGDLGLVVRVVGVVAGGVDIDVVQVIEDRGRRIRPRQPALDRIRRLLRILRRVGHDDVRPHGLEVAGDVGPVADHRDRGGRIGLLDAVEDMRLAQRQAGVVAGDAMLVRPVAGEQRAPARAAVGGLRTAGQHVAVEGAHRGELAQRRRGRAAGAEQRVATQAVDADHQHMAPAVGAHDRVGNAGAGDQRVMVIRVAGVVGL